MDTGTERRKLKTEIDAVKKRIKDSNGQIARLRTSLEKAIMFISGTR